MSNRRTFRWGIRDAGGRVHAGGCDHRHRRPATAQDCLDRYTRRVCEPGNSILGAGLMTGDDRPLTADEWIDADHWSSLSMTAWGLTERRPYEAAA